MSLGVLALHVAASPGVICDWAAEDITQFKGDPTPTPASTEEILAAHDQSVTASKDILGKIGDAGLERMWTQRPAQDFDGDAERSSGARDRHEALDSSSRPVVGVPPPAGRSGPVDLRSERRREPVRRALLRGRLVATGVCGSVAAGLR